jgi:LmbE family N-acetylglucosaminyl deacetylase
VLAVVAHPDDESFGLGALLSAFATSGTAVSVLCFTHGEASTLHGVAGDLQNIRAAELAAAATLLGLQKVDLRDHPDGALTDVPLETLAADAVTVARAQAAEGLVVFDTTGITGHPDHRWATRAALAAGALLDLPVLAWTLPEQVTEQLNTELGTAFLGQPAARIDQTVTIDRSRQLQAVRAHPSQAVPGAPLWRRLELLGNQEHLRVLQPLRQRPRVELLFTADCPNWLTALDHLARALLALGQDDQDIALTVVHDEPHAHLRHVSGSPTVLLDGVDPFASPAAIAGLACRLYDTPDGRRGAPSVRQLTAAMTSLSPPPAQAATSVRQTCRRTTAADQCASSFGTRSRSVAAARCTASTAKNAWSRSASQVEIIDVVHR